MDLNGFRTRSLIIGFTLAIVAGALPATAAQASLVAPRSACSGQANEQAREGDQEDAMRCLINYARDHAGVGGLSKHSKLEKAAGRKQRDIVNCGFSHTACGLQADLYPHKFGYTQGTLGWALGENLAWGRSGEGSARNVLEAWLASPGHRSTMLHGAFDHLGLGLYRGSFGGKRDTAVWVLEVGCRGC